MEGRIKENTIKIKSRAMGYSNGQMGGCMKASGRMVSSMVREDSPMMRVRSPTVFGKTGRKRKP